MPTTAPTSLLPVLSFSLQHASQSPECGMSSIRSAYMSTLKLSLSSVGVSINRGGVEDTIKKIMWRTEEEKEREREEEEEEQYEEGEGKREKPYFTATTTLTSSLNLQATATTPDVDAKIQQILYPLKSKRQLNDARRKWIEVIGILCDRGRKVKDVQDIINGEGVNKH
mmetsp:Transcript_10290/g.21153  ORF Transcript_10290/g.21153 Transcript_10290/m.21153 type:complete len:169 (-) Transcript_10290:147-653(-)|eukprot:CAMPEP_0118647486 /NCGR_PEP_ID=MMETSP0785-20121206/8632_1 /TAXON_ID=91992 /ORGANISM="Bolidomonas pacifica, Strain CCMP 1866" /LENGTH=168 /DNA_ID=CAMNT_0006539583 /DNA_START=176 /DNA_END=682 /DNA_ORIENTATION=+